jgi:hypothetical protein
VRCVRELNSGSCELVSSARNVVVQALFVIRRMKESSKGRTTPVIKLGRDAYRGPVLGRKGKVGLAHA